MATVTERYGPPGPQRRARMLADGKNPTLADYTPAERADLEAHAEAELTFTPVD